MKRITMDAGKNAVNEKKHLDKLYSSMISWVYTLKKMPECEAKWLIKKNFEVPVRQVLGNIRELRRRYDT